MGDVGKQKSDVARKKVVTPEKVWYKNSFLNISDTQVVNLFSQKLQVSRLTFRDFDMASTHQLRVQDIFSVKDYVCLVTGGMVLVFLSPSFHDF